MYFFIFFNFSIISVITILPKQGQNIENTTFLHVKMTVVQGCVGAKIFRIVFYEQNGPKTVKKWPNDGPDNLFTVPYRVRKSAEQTITTLAGVIFCRFLLVVTLSRASSDQWLGIDDSTRLVAIN